MFKFIQALFGIRHKGVTVILWEDQNSDNPQTFRFIPIRFFLLLTVSLLIVTALVHTALFLTPLGNTIYNKSEGEIRDQVIQVGSRLAMLQEALNERDSQLRNMREILRKGIDTTFVFDFTTDFIVDSQNPPTEVQQPTFESISFDFLRSPEVSLLVPVDRGPIFPVSLPVNGLLTANFDSEIGHFGIDIAATAGTPFRALADGVVLNIEWTMNYGYVIYVQHGDGYLSVYKHSAGPTRKTGDIIQKGDILGSVSESGLISTGPHLHYELWRNGRPLNPVNYMMN